MYTSTVTGNLFSHSKNVFSLFLKVVDLSISTNEYELVGTNSVPNIPLRNSSDFNNEPYFTVRNERYDKLIYIKKVHKILKVKKNYM